MSGEKAMAPCKESRCGSSCFHLQQTFPEHRLPSALCCSSPIDALWWDCKISPPFTDSALPSLGPRQQLKLRQSCLVFVSSHLECTLVVSFTSSCGEGHSLPFLPSFSIPAVGSSSHPTQTFSFTTGAADWKAPVTLLGSWFWLGKQLF